MIGATIFICIIAVWIFDPSNTAVHTLLGIFAYIAIKVLFRMEKSTIKKNKQILEEMDRDKEIWMEHGALPSEIWIGASRDVVISRWGEPHHIEKRPRTYQYFYDKQRIRYKNHVTLDNRTKTVVSFSSSRRQK